MRPDGASQLLRHIMSLMRQDLILRDLDPRSAFACGSRAPCMPLRVPDLRMTKPCYLPRRKSDASAPGSYPRTASAEVWIYPRLSSWRPPRLNRLLSYC